MGFVSKHSSVRRFEEMCGLLENSSDSEPFSVHELRQCTVDKRKEEAVYSCKQLKRKLLEQYGEHIFRETTWPKGRYLSTFLQNMAGHTLSDKWNADRKLNTTDESRCITEAAASLIKADIREQKYSTDTHDSIYHLALQTHWMPTLLLLLTQQLVL